MVPKKQAKLGQWLATGICGNDITSSCLYVAAIATAYAGILSPVVLILVAGLLFLFRSIYSEVCDAMPLNGGAYNALLNTTTKFKASVAACLTFLSYMATACISAKTAVEYLGALAGGIPILPVTIGLLGLFALLALLGITESARVALGIFVIHMIALSLLVILGVAHLVADPSIFQMNWNLELPDGNSLMIALFFGFSAALLGISGFESSANYIEEQADGVFPKTLRNMWLAITFFNPMIALIALSVLHIPDIVANKDFMLANVGSALGGDWLKTLISIDAALVLSGAVLTAYVGSAGLLGRMALDRCLPQFLLIRNKRQTQHYIILTFFILCTSILWLTQGDLLSLGAVYTLSFLGVMFSFALGNALLKIRRARLPRRYHASWFAIAIALVATAGGFVGNIVLKEKSWLYWLAYLLPTVFLVWLMLYRHHILRVFLKVANDIANSISNTNARITEKITRAVDRLESHGIIFFTKGDDAANLNRAMLYVRENEITHHVTVIHVYDTPEDIPENLERDLRTLDSLYPELEIELVLRQGKFSPELIDQISREFGVPKNYMFLGAPSDKFPHHIGDLGGVRLII